MHSRSFAVLMYGAVALAPPAGAAQPIPTQPDAPVPALKYVSGFAGYVSFREEELVPWREVNDEAARAGGHIGIVGGAHGGHPPGKPAVKPPASGTAQN